MRAIPDDSPHITGATTGCEAELRAMADALRGSMGAAEYKHVVFGLIFLKYISDAFEDRSAARWPSGCCSALAGEHGTTRKTT